MITGLGVAAAALPVLTSPPAAAAPPHRDPTIEITTVNGSGCRPETVTVTPRSSGFTIRYSDYSAKIGGDALPTDYRKNCQLGLRIIPTEGFTYAVMAVDHRGSAQLAPDATGVLKASHEFAGSPRQAQTTHSFKGPLSGGWQVAEKIDPGQLVWASCREERNLNISTELRVNAVDRTTANTFDMHSGLGSAYHFAWKTC
ncbi:DUF4360 domain-containing protein [Actinomadura sp. KC06]|nr:DUF4360 domain-containing protein [Actinomadura sp. KC06]